MAYAQDCGRLFWRTLDHPLITDDTLAFGTAMSLWASECPNEPWDPVPDSAEPAEVGSIELKLVAAMGRQASFFYQVNRPGFVVSVEINSPFESTCCVPGLHLFKYWNICYKGATHSHNESVSEPGG